jgi:hypothetical protein
MISIKIKTSNSISLIKDNQYYLFLIYLFDFWVISRHSKFVSWPNFETLARIIIMPVRIIIILAIGSRGYTTDAENWNKFFKAYFERKWTIGSPDETLAYILIIVFDFLIGAL